MPANKDKGSISTAKETLASTSLPESERVVQEGGYIHKNVSASKMDKSASQRLHCEYQLIRLLGKGKGTMVWLAKDKRGKELVLKQIDNKATDHRLIAAEVEAGRRLHHSGIVKLHASYQNESHTTLVLEVSPHKLLFLNCL